MVDLDDGISNSPFLVKKLVDNAPCEHISHSSWSMKHFSGLKKNHTSTNMANMLLANVE